jgi:glycosyltransferase involved in cell wall biosynthesis
MNLDARRPTVTIVLPTYNRASFLADAFESIERQTFSNWELVIVDDGSTDETRAVVARFADSHAHSVRYLFQSNRGPAAARNLGVHHAAGPYVAFFDSDDIWLPEYLARGARALDANADIDWVFSACRIVDLSTGLILDPNTFYQNGRERPFLALNVEKRDHDVNVIVDARALEYQLVHGLYCGPQNSMIRRTVFEHCAFPEHLRVGEDQFLVISALAQGRRLAYYPEPQVIYRIHDENSSGSSKTRSPESLISVLEPLARALQQLPLQLSLNRRERRALNKRLGREYFWRLGYSLYWQTGRRARAMEMFGQGLAAWPWDPGAWKTYLLSRLKLAVGGVRE